MYAGLDPNQISTTDGITPSPFATDNGFQKWNFTGQRSPQTDN